MTSWAVAVWLLPRRLLGLLVKGYRLLLSPWLGSSCRFEPTCSAYSLTALSCHGAVIGSVLTVGRLARCQPWCDGGYDPVPATFYRFRTGRRPLFSGLMARSTKKKSP